MATVNAHEAPHASRPHADTTITWAHIPLVAQVALVGQRDGMPVAVIDQIGSAGFRASLCSGKNVGVFRTLDECKRAVAAALESVTTVTAG
jgi:hypothetical protein